MCMYDKLMPLTWVTVAIHTGYRQTGAVYTRRSGPVQIQPDWPPISVRARIGSNSIVCIFVCSHC